MLNRTGRVLTRFGAELIIEDETGRRLRCTARRRLQDVVCGDHVTWTPSDSGNHVVTGIEPRRNLLERVDPRGQRRAVAANIDQVVLIIARQPPPQWPLVDRYLVAIEALEARAVIVMNKVDLEEAAPGSDDTGQMESLYRDLGYPMLHTSAATGAGLGELRARLAGLTSILLGQSGVGKSSLIKALLPDEDLRIGALSEGTGEGRHTTTAATLYHLPDGGDLIDSPGVRDFTPPPLQAEALAHGFVEFRPHLGQCRFHNCVHDREPGCAIKAAVDAGEISEPRYKSYLALKRS
ncbi:ribosome small subunit-dependent GTPase A [Thioalkalivibrio denitrificans]|uniref:Small ribosomal subunit biogenesis GTPase RsgA n=1 Tax=Thioalkalivibrio denitrificans TaxID=108003 RepID=A0A1V3NQE1_9GAMM|nr:ribosome small subunit-dependent GTPase A [Thioalkalivibrio denitrificans]OOG27224.1 ribosome small subunit-dependent GTPase A [Thioalkalivibrio denitrificans]